MVGRRCRAGYGDRVVGDRALVVARAWVEAGAGDRLTTGRRFRTGSAASALITLFVFAAGCARGSGPASESIPPSLMEASAPAPAEVASNPVVEQLPEINDPRLLEVVRAIGQGYVRAEQLGDSMIVGPTLWQRLTRYGTPVLGHARSVRAGFDAETAVLADAREMAASGSLAQFMEMPAVVDMARKFSRGDAIALARPWRRFLATQLADYALAPTVSGVRRHNGEVLMGVFVADRLIWLEMLPVLAAM